MRVLGGHWEFLTGAWQGHPWCHGWPCLSLKIYPESCMLIPLIEVCEECWVKNGAMKRLYLGFLKESWRRGLSLLSWLIMFDPKEVVDIFMRRVLEKGVKNGCTWRTMSVTDRRHEGKGYPWWHGWSWFTLRKVPWKFGFNDYNSSVSIMRLLGSSLMTWIILFEPKEDTLKV